MINVSTYWTLPPSRQGKIRAKIEKADKELLRVVGYADLVEKGEYIEGDILCLPCYNRAHKHWRGKIWMPVTKEQYTRYLDNFDCDFNCSECNKPLA